MKKPAFLGAHLSIAGGLATVFDRASQVKATAIQIFTKSNKAYFAKKLTPGEIDSFKDAWQKSDVKIVVTHAAYLINIGASNPEVEEKSRTALREELERCHQLGIAYLVLHPGAHTGSGMDVGVARVAQNLSYVLAQASGDCMVLLETAAGQGSSIGTTLEQLRAIYDASDPAVRHRIGVCVDTCHIFAAGYDIGTPAGYEEFWARFESIVGFQLLKCIHLNDSKTDVGACVDRHANLGTGKIPMSTMQLLVNDERLAGVPIVLETPSEDGITEYKTELALLRKIQAE